MSKPERTPAPRNSFGAGILEGIRAVQSGRPVPMVQPGPMMVPLDQIEPDPDQPRRSAGDTELTALATSIRMTGGVLQPIGLRELDGGRYRIVFGERRWRAAGLAGLDRIPAVMVPTEQANLPAQVIENQHRRALSAGEIAAAVKRLDDSGMRNADIAAALNIPEQQLKHYRCADQLPPVLAGRLTVSPMRVLYELWTAWQRLSETGRTHLEALIAALPDDEGPSLAEARRWIGGAEVADVPALSVPLVQPAPEPPPAPLPAAPAPRPARPAPRRAPAAPVVRALLQAAAATLRPGPEPDTVVLSRASWEALIATLDAKG